MRKYLSKFLSLILAVVLVCSLGTVSASAYEYGTDPDNAHISGSGVNFRKGPGTSYAVKGVYSYGTSVTLLEELENGWCKVSIFGVEGYVYGSYVTRGNSPSTPISLDTTTYTGTEAGYVNTNNVNLRSLPSTSSASLGTLLKGTQVDILSYLSSGWYGVMINGHPGFIYCDYISIGTYDALDEFITCWENPMTLYCNISGVVVRSAPSSSATAIATLPIYVEVQVLTEYSNGWYGISYKTVSGSQLTGYVYKYNLDEQQTIIDEVVPEYIDIEDVTAYVVADNVAWRTGPGTSFPIAKYLSKRTAVTVTGEYVNSDGVVIWYQTSWTDTSTGLTYGPGCIAANYIVSSLSEVPYTESNWVTYWDVGASGIINVDNTPAYHVSGNGAIIGYLAYGTPLTVDREFSNGWLLVTIEAGPCYVYKTAVSY